MKRLIILLMVALVGVNVGYAQKLTARERKAQKEKEVTEWIENRQFRFVAQSVIPLAGPKIDLTSVYDLTVDSTWVESWLPFFGRAYHVDYGDTEGGIKFKEQAKSMEVRFNERKKTYQINLEVDTPKDNYKIQISAGVGGYAHVDVLSNNRQSVGYYGIIEALPEEDEK
ncbi:DUF4251 domain-containing protein [Gaoshiqia sediminis]|uniref:DUF4251 domain-containing protein n=1 Tax=Gaoshiqia sediminis TaxID=2986998 RepID=A0AA41Y752_9BACT|nr:DUF4251 domain-containing protein [Gaoshiqia sediminis]MCW0483189.1 DUF4251 domain-containing protein [Gaoshiqia sediminis]